MKLGLIGCGKMGGALLSGVMKAGLVKPEDISVCDAVSAATDAIKKQHPALKVCVSAGEVVGNSEVAILAVKPKDMQALLNGMLNQSVASNREALEELVLNKDIAQPFEDTLFISIAAGITLTQIQEWSYSARVIRVMPNTPAQIGLGYSAFARGNGVSDADAGIARKIFGAVGRVDEVEEKLIDAVTGLSGSGPAYVFTVIEALADAGVLMGLPRSIALRAAAQTVAGAAQMVVQTGEHPATLRDNVASPGGTTIAGLEQLEKHGLRNALLQAVRRATERSKELAKS